MSAIQTVKHDPVINGRATSNSGKQIFVGPNGLRAGWRLAIFVLMLVAMGAVARAMILRFLIPAGFAPEAFTPWSVAVQDAIFVPIVAIAAWVMSKIEGRKIGQYGLPWRQGLGKQLCLGSGIGFLASSATLLVIYLLHGLQIAGPTIHGTTILMSAAAWAGAFVLSAIAEEFLFRGYAQFTLTMGIGFWPAAAVLSGLFGLGHLSNKGENILGALSVVAFGLLLCLFLKRTGTLWCAVGFHIGYDWGQTFFYGAPNSGLTPSHNLFNVTLNGPRWLTGGTVGPEASLVCPLVLAVVAILFSLKYRKARYQTVIS
ncbi:MAG TPA: type II CAAX endopeptidase family protein [Terriglobales bacterium]|nr:type II CAAX endopeptidase family protein [Terriglobales bacterium]